MHAKKNGKPGCVIGMRKPLSEVFGITVFSSTGQQRIEAELVSQSALPSFFVIRDVHTGVHYLVHRQRLPRNERKKTKVT